MLEGIENADLYIKAYQGLCFSNIAFYCRLSRYLERVIEDTKCVIVPRVEQDLFLKQVQSWTSTFFKV